MVDHLRVKILKTFITFIIIYLLLTGYFKLRYPFWSRQPVFHLHNLFYWIRPPGIINEDLPEKNRFYDETIDFYNYDMITTEKKELFGDFIRNNYLPDSYEKYSATNECIYDNFESHNNKSFMSMKIYNNKILSCMTTKPLECYIDGNKMVINYVDYLCVDMKHRKKMYAANQIFTHYYHLRNNCNNIVSFFKRENNKTMIVPLTSYNNYIFKIENWEMCYNFDQPNINIIFINKSNMNRFYQLFFECKKSFKCFIALNLGHIFYLIEKEHIKITVLMINDKFKCFYVFRNPYTTYDGANSLEFCSSFKGENIDDNIFTLGFLISMSLISKDLRSEILLIENLSNNNIILKLLLDRYSYIAKPVNSLYFYNFAYHPKESKDIFCII
jgi:hypothetical protein